jgi:hypothetical protein
MFSREGDVTFKAIHDLIGLPIVAELNAPDDPVVTVRVCVPHVDPAIESTPDRGQLRVI